MSPQAWHCKEDQQTSAVCTAFAKEGAATTKKVGEAAEKKGWLGSRHKTMLGKTMHLRLAHM